jgi:hypothetical protein
MNQQELSERLWDFAARVGKVVDALPDSRLGRHVAGQLVFSERAHAIEKAAAAVQRIGILEGNRAG